MLWHFKVRRLLPAIRIGFFVRPRSLLWRNTLAFANSAKKSVKIAFWLAFNNLPIGLAFFKGRSPPKNQLKA
jgi:hypothetical protein